MANYDNELYEIGQVIKALGVVRPENLNEKEQRNVLQWYGVGSGYYHQFFKLLEKINKNEIVYKPPLIEDKNVDSSNFKERVGTDFSEVYKFYSWLAGRPAEEEKEEPKKEKKEEKEEDEKTGEEGATAEKEEKEKAPPPPKEEVSIPADIKERVEEYRRVQANKIEEDEEHTVANAVKRARNTWLSRREKEIIRENRLKQIEDSQGLEIRKKQEALEVDQRDKFLIENINPKAQSAGSLNRNLELYLKEAVLFQNPKLNPTQVNQLVDELSYLSYTGAIDLQNDSDLYIATQLAFKDLGLPINPSLNTLDEYVSSQNNALQTDPYSDKADQIEQNIISLDEEIRDIIQKETQDLPEKIKASYPDFADHRDNATTEVSRLQEKLIQVIPSTPSSQLNPLSGVANDLENSLRGLDKDLRVNPEGLGKRTEELIRITGSNSQKISAEVVHLFSIGLTVEKFNKHIEYAKTNPGSDIGKLYSTNKTVFDQVHYQLEQIAKSKLGSDIDKGLRPVGAIDRYYNNLNPNTRGILKIVVDPKGTVTSWANGVIGRQIGRRLIENSGNIITQKLGNFLLKEGLEQGVKAFAKETAKKVALEVTKKIGVTLVGDSLVATVAVALGIPTAGASLLIGAVLIAGQFVLDQTIGFTKKQVDKLWIQLYGEKYDWKKLGMAAGSFGVGIAGTGAAFMGAFFTSVTATKAAAISMVSTLAISSLIVLFYIGLTFMVAPILSTLVQFDSVEKVKYEDYVPLGPTSSDCGWPTKGHYMVQNGPEGATHSRNKLQAIDIFGPTSINATPQISSTDGTVETAGPFRNYGNTIVVKTSNAAGSFQVAYGHMGSMKVGVGARVKQGDVIGTVGSTALFPNPHIHWEVIGIKYNQCPAGGVKMPIGCNNFPSCGNVYTN